MKKKILAVVLVSGLAIATVASANWGKGGRGYNGAVNCPQLQATQQLDPEVQAKVDAFYIDTADLRKEMIVKQAEKRAIMRATNPDPDVGSKLAGELFDLRNSLRDKAIAAGVEQYVGPKMGNAKRGNGGYGQGKGMRGGGRGGWQQNNTTSSS